MYTIWQGFTNVFTLNDTVVQNLSSVFTLSYPELPLVSESPVWSQGHLMVPGISVQATHLLFMLPVPHADFMQGCFLQAGFKKC